MSRANVALLQLCFLALFVGSVVSQITTRPPTCSRLNFQNLLKSCCSATYAPAFPVAALSVCTKNTTLYNWANSYQMQTLSTTNARGRIIIIITWCCPCGGVIIDIQWLRKASVCGAAEMAECVFKQKKLLTVDGRLDVPALASYYASSQKLENWPGMAKGVALSLDDQLSTMSVANTTLTCPPLKAGQPNRKFNLLPLIAMQAYQAALIQSCPSPVQTATCTKQFSDFNYCAHEGKYSKCLDF